MFKKTFKISLLLFSALAISSCGSKEKNSDKEDSKSETNPNLLSYEQLYDQKIYETIEDALKEPDKVYRLHVLYNTLKTDGKFPTEILKLKKLQELKIGANDITEIPEGLGELKDLQYLDLGGNPIKKIPESFGKLKFLINFTLNNAEITTFPSSTQNLTKLEFLECVSCNLEKFPVVLTKLTQLKDLNLSSNSIESIPSEIGNMNSLRSLSLMFNKLSSLPTEIGKLKNLEQLLLSNNNIQEIPSSMGQLTNLSMLSIEINNLSKIPESLSNLNKLRSLSIGGNKNMDYKQAFIIASKMQELESLQINSMGGKMDAESTMPKEISNLKIKSISIIFNKFTNQEEAFELISKISTLETMMAGNCNLSKIPAAMFKMKNLRMIVLSGNKNIQKSDFENLKKALPKTNIPDIFR